MTEQENMLLNSGEKQFGIYQITERDPEHNYRFMGLDYVQKKGITVSRADYDLIYTAPLTEKDTLDGIYERFNIQRPADFTGHSLSVSDVVVLNDGSTVKAYYVDSIGFAELPDFFKERNLDLQKENLLNEELQEIEIFDKPGLFSNGRLRDEDVPEGLYGAEESKKVCYYICRARQADDKCIGHQITEKLLKALVMDQLHLFIVRLSDKRKVLEELRKIEDMQNPVYRAKSEIMSLTDKVSQMAKKREQLYADYVAGVVDSEDYQLIREDYSKQYDGLRAALQRAEAKKVEVEQQIREYLNMTSNLEEHLDDFGFDAQLVKSLVQRIEVSADKRIRIVFGFQDVFADLGKESAGK